MVLMLLRQTNELVGGESGYEGYEEGGRAGEERSRSLIGRFRSGGALIDRPTAIRGGEAT